MSTPCGRCKPSGSLCKVDLRSGRCCECIRRGRICDLSITREEWFRLKKEKANLEKALEDREEAKMATMTKKIQLRKELAVSVGQKAEATERELACIIKDEDKEYVLMEVDISLPRSPFALAHGLQMSPQEWALTERLPGHFWGSPSPQTLADDETVFGEFDSV